MNKTSPAGSSASSQSPHLDRARIPEMLAPRDLQWDGKSLGMFRQRIHRWFETHKDKYKKKSPVSHKEFWGPIWGWLKTKKCLKWKTKQSIWDERMPSTTVLTEICPFNQICPQSGRLSSIHRMGMDKVIKDLPGKRSMSPMPTHY